MLSEPIVNKVLSYILLSIAYTCTTIELIMSQSPSHPHTSHSPLSSHPHILTPHTLTSHTPLSSHPHLRTPPQSPTQRWRGREHTPRPLVHVLVESCQSLGGRIIVPPSGGRGCGLGEKNTYLVRMIAQFFIVSMHSSKVNYGSHKYSISNT